MNAHVDGEIRGLIEALNSFPHLRTLTSCQGTCPRGASVSFVYGEDCYDAWKGLANFVLGWLGPRLSQKVGDAVDLSVRVTTLGDVHANLYVRPGALKLATRELKCLSRQFKRTYPTP